MLINIADPAVDSHIAHGDVFADTNGLDENCAPVSQYPGGCYAYELDTFVCLDGGSAVEDIIGEQPYLLSNCTDIHSGWQWVLQYAIWAADITEADNLCQQQFEGEPAGGITSYTQTVGLYQCLADD